MTRRSDSVDTLLASLADPTRRGLYEAIIERPGVTTSELVDRAPSISRWGVMKHLDVMRSSGLIQTMATGRFRRHYAERSALDPLRAWLQRVS
jgi:predicted transcriptional regulator